MSLPLLLLGTEAEALAPRLVLSGYQPLGLKPGQPEPMPLAGEMAATVTAAPQAVVLDPDQDARIPELRRRWGALPILLGLSEDTVEGRSRILLSGADDFWLTAIGPSDLLTRLRLHRQLPAVAAGQELIQVADLQLSPASRLASRGGRELALTAREYQLLLLLLEHRGQVLGREEILRQVWPDQAQGSASNVIEVYVRYLRQKLEQGGERRLLHTVRGRGYCLCEGLPPCPDGG